MAPRSDSVVVSGAAGALGQRVVGRLAASEGVGRVLALDTVSTAEPVPGSCSLAVDLVSTDLRPLLEGADTLVHLAFTTAVGPDPDDEVAAANAEGTRRLLDAATATGVGHVVVVSSATVYGAWPDNPVPLTEEAAVRPNPGFGYGLQKAEVERQCREWSLAQSGSTSAILRPAPVLGGGEESWLARALQAASPIRTAEVEPVAQFVHVDDLASAVVLAAERRLDGVYNVAADGWVSAEEERALAGAPPRLKVPERLATRVAAWGWRWRIGRLPPGLIPYTQHPWVVANDRLRAVGWTPTSTNEEAYVVARKGTPWSRLSPKRRQELALAGGGVLLLAGAGGVVLTVLRLRRRR
ncbi:MAG: NAD-dependent epimerase/dehydratase family protein [Acidimicrobiia bacterium]|nr:NAD-dependent epimerase/dehydratase family protein [Acidimicrobiia bacterium]